MKKNLVVDLDGTLVRTDMLYETFWSAFSKKWTTPIKSLFWLFSGKAKLKYKLAHLSDIDPKLLPFNQEVISQIKQHRKKGGYTLLATASNQIIAEKISKYLNIFDEVKGSSKRLNLKGNSKAEFLKTRFGVKKYDYMGNSFDDLLIWKNANKAIIVDANLDVVKDCKRINSNQKIINSKTKQNTLFSLIKSIRVYQWIKNLLVFLPMLASYQMTEQNFILSFLAFISFSFIASSVYVINDLLDLKADRSHPEKKNRTFASGEMSIKSGFILFSILLILGITVSFNTEIYFFLITILYFIFTLTYSLILKKKPIIDILILAILYTFRIVGGSFATGINITFWLFTFSIFLFLSLAAVKRQSELVDLKKRKKLITIGRGYKVTDLPIITMIAVSSCFMSVLVAGLYINSPIVSQLYSQPWTLGLGSFVLLFWLIKMIFDSNRGLINSDPIIYAVKDNISRMCFFIVFLLFSISLIY